MKDYEIINMLGVSITQGTCLEIMEKELKKREQCVQGLLKNDNTPFSTLRLELQTYQAYEAVVDRFRKYLGHES